MQQSVDYHDSRHSNVWRGASQNVGAQHVQHLASPAQQSVAHHEARVQQQRLQQIRTAQIAAHQQRQHRAKTVVSSQQRVSAHAGGWQRKAAVNSHTDNAYSMYQG